MTTSIDTPAVQRPAGEIPTHRMLIGSEWVASGDETYLDSVNPSTGEVIARIPRGTAEDVDRAVRAARGAFENGYNKFSPAERERAMHRLADLIEENFDELRMLDVVDMGMPFALHPPDATGVAGWLRYFAGWATKIGGDTVQPTAPAGDLIAMTFREPVGVVGAIIPWNGPLRAVMFKLGPALAVGCTVVLKPAEDASLCALRVGELVLEAGFPPGTVNVVTGLGSVVGAAMAAHPDIDKISFTGSTLTGQQIMRAAAGNMKRLTMEMGGKSPNIVFADADLDKAVPGCAISVFAGSGQVCCAGSRIFVERSVYDEFNERLVAFSGHLKVGPSIDPQTFIGPVASQRQLTRVEGYLETGRREGARLLAGGSRVTEGELAKGYFVPPTVFADVEDSMTIAREEIFGPVASVLPFDSEAEVLARGNATPFGLGGGVWTRDVGRAMRISRGLRTGTVYVNTALQFDPAVPFAGYKMSGWGSDIGAAALESVLTTKAVWLDVAP